MAILKTDSGKCSLSPQRSARLTCSNYTGFNLPSCRLPPEYRYSFASLQYVMHTRRTGGHQLTEKMYRHFTNTNKSPEFIHDATDLESVINRNVHLHIKCIGAIRRSHVELFFTLIPQRVSMKIPLW